MTYSKETLQAAREIHHELIYKGERSETWIAGVISRCTRDQEMRELLRAAVPMLTEIAELLSVRGNLHTQVSEWLRSAEAMLGEEANEG